MNYGRWMMDGGDAHADDDAADDDDEDSDDDGDDDYEVRF